MNKAANIDFNAVSYAHEPIHERLINWARWVKPVSSSWIHPMWHGFQSSNTLSGTEGKTVPIDSIDAQKLEELVYSLPEQHKFAVRWCYVYGGNPRRAAKHVGESMQGLADLVANGRQMLINKSRRNIA